MTVAGISNVSAVTVHNYKRYKKGVSLHVYTRTVNRVDKTCDCILPRLIFFCSFCSNMIMLATFVYQDVLIGFNFAPLVFQNKSTGQLEVDLVRTSIAFIRGLSYFMTSLHLTRSPLFRLQALAHDVREQRGGGGEDLRASCHLKRHNSTIRIKSSKSLVFQ